MLFIISFLQALKTKVVSSFSDMLDILFGMPRVSILAPLLFNINVCYFFLSEYSSTFANFADDNYNEVINKLEDTIQKLFQCNNFNANASQCYFFYSPYEPVTIKIKESAIESSNSETPLGVTIDSKLSFNDKNTNLCGKIIQNLHVLSSVAIYMSFDKKMIFFKNLRKLLTTSQFNYCPLVRMYNRTNIPHERAVRILYQDKK